MNSSIKFERADDSLNEEEGDFEGIIIDFFFNLFSSSCSNDMDQVLFTCTYEGYSADECNFEYVIY